uniref:Trehalose phosphorylase n=1 Tax=Talaromyces marneffei PM1 TaxID=1077442 RepID=A0A093VDU6_TALMA
MLPAKDTYKFQRRGSVFQRDLNRPDTERCAWQGPPLDALYAGISVQYKDSAAAIVAIAIRDTTYLLDFYEHRFNSEPKKRPDEKDVSDLIVDQLRQYSEQHLERFTGLAMPQDVADQCPHLCSRLWRELDIVPIAFIEGVPLFTDSPNDPKKWNARCIDELAEAMSRRCVRFFGPSNNPILDVGFQGLVEVDCASRIRIATLDDYEPTVGHTTWRAVNHYAAELKKRHIKIAFFSATPQGGGVALMRHALVRYARELGIDLKWYVPKPRPGVFRITKTNHNILQGVSAPGERFTKEQQQTIEEWLQENAHRFWLSQGGPLRAPSEGGADLVIVDDPQMPSLIPIAKHIAPDRPVIFRSHIQIRSDLVGTPGTPQHEAWAWMWDRIQHADVFISHPVEAFVPANVPKEKVGYMPATTDWLDGLNKTMRDWDVAAYGRMFNMLCHNNRAPTIDYPDDEYIIQIARFDPSKGIPDVLESYARFHELLKEKGLDNKPPKLLICGHGSIDDPDGNVIYDVTLRHIESKLPHLKDLICVMRIGPSDQILNALLSKAKIALQLSTREGFEVKVSEAIHKDRNLYDRMSMAALTTVSDEVTTVGNALCWLYLAEQLTAHKKIKPKERWINDMAREEAGLPVDNVITLDDSSNILKSQHEDNIKNKGDRYYRSPPNHPIPLPRQPPLGALNPIPLPNLTHNPRRSTTHHTKTRHNHIGRYHRAIQHIRKIFEDRHVSDHDIVADVYMITDLSGFDDGVLPDEDVIAYFERVVRMQAPMESRGGPQDRGAGDVSANDGFGLDYGFAAEDDMLGAVDEGAAGYFVAGVGFDVLALCGFGRHDDKQNSDIECAK